MTGEKIPDAGVDLELLERWMDGRGLGSGPVVAVEAISGGTQNVLLRFRRDDQTFVLRRPPLHKRANGDETNRREARILNQLGDTAVPHPRLIAACSDDTVAGAPFYLMQSVDGVNPTEGMPVEWYGDRRRQRQMGLSVVDGLVALRQVDIVTHELTGLGRAEGWLDRQVGRWRSQLDSYAEIPNYPGADLPHVERVTQWLESHVPQHFRPALIHGDYHFANVLVTRDGAGLVAIVDWELSTIGDARLDLGHLLAAWPRASGPTAALNATVAAGLPSVDDAIAHYVDRTGEKLDDLLWFRVLACYRLAILLEGSNARAMAGRTSQEIGDRLAALAVELFDQAATLLSS